MSPLRAFALAALGAVAFTALWVSYTFLCASGGLEPLPGVEILWTWGLGFLLVWWVRTDRKQSRYWPCFDYGIFMMAGWPILLPHYLFRTRGAKGLLVFGSLPIVLLLTFLFVGFTAYVLAQ